MRNPSVMGSGHTFARVPTISHPRSVFNRSSGHKTAIDTDYLYPIYWDSVLPGDTKVVKAHYLVRVLSAILRPLMDNLYIDTFYFFVPLRILWTNFVKFMGEQENPADSISYVTPKITSPNVAGGGIPVGHLYDYFGLPTGPLNGGGATTGLTVNNFYGRAYNQIWNYFFRSEMLQNSVTKDTGDGPDTWSNYNLLKRCKRFDYFTSALPYTQKSSVAVSLPLGTSAPVRTSTDQQQTGINTAMTLRVAASGGVPTDSILGSYTGVLGGSGTPGANAGSMYPSNLYADLSTATAATINALRESISLQQFLENDARGGTRYPELIQVHFGVTNPDSRVQRPEILSLYSERLKINPVVSTAYVDATYALGAVGGFGTGIVQNGYTKSFTEHGVVLGLMNIRADLTYQQGVDREWSKSTRYDFYWPEFANLGEQSILNREIYANLADGTGAAQKDGVFGYISRYDEYRYKPSKIIGVLRSTAAQTLDIWHLSQNFSTQPTLGTTFISEAVPLDRAIAIPGQPQFIVDAFFEQKDARCMPVYAIPGLKRL